MNSKISVKNLYQWKKLEKDQIPDFCMLHDCYEAITTTKVFSQFMQEHAGHYESIYSPFCQQNPTGFAPFMDMCNDYTLPSTKSKYILHSTVVNFSFFIFHFYILLQSIN